MLAFSDTGAGQPLVLVHGIGSDRRRWEPLVEQLADDHRCVAVDLPGHGESPAEGCDLLSATVAVHEVVEHLGLAEPVVVGHSLGASLGLLHGALYPSTSVVAIDPVGLHLPHLAASLAPYRHRLQGDDFAAAFAEWEARFPLDLVPEPLRSEVREATHPAQEVVLSYWRTTLDEEASASVQPLLADTLASIAVPTLVLLADEPTVEDRAVLDRMRTTTVEVHPELGHYPHLVDPPGFCRRVREWEATAGATGLGQAGTAG